MFHDKIKQELVFGCTKDSFVVHFGIQDSLVRSLFGRGATTQFSASTKPELFEKIDSVIDELLNENTKPKFGILLAYPRSLSVRKGVRPIPVFEHQKEQVIYDLKVIKDLI